MSGKKDFDSSFLKWNNTGCVASAKKFVNALEGNKGQQRPTRAKQANVELCVYVGETD